ncbi:zonular occludens toxin domain-containing protein [Novispirillum sp. DQ9]|uniref:zonular occludens toxin domain-containing protein n=1 Tax=Novispirillum sp. DQ9 TaxID=3398612 RepID=UPI003C7C63EF
MAGKLLIGKPGAGKSYTAVADEILPALRMGRLVITNLPLQMDVLRQFVPNADALVHLRQSFGPEFFGVWDQGGECWQGQDVSLTWRHPTTKGMGPLLLVDEAHEHFPLKKTDQNVLFWFAKHRHAGADFICITQRTKKLHIDVRELCEFTVIVRRSQVVKLIKPKYLFKSTYVRLIYDGVEIGWNSQPLHKQIRYYDPKVYKLYQSFTMGGGEFKRKRPTGFQGLKWPALILAGALLVALLAGGDDTSAPQAPAPAPVVVEQAAPPAMAPPPPAPEPTPAETPHQQEVQRAREAMEEAVYQAAVARVLNGDTTLPPVPRLAQAPAGPLQGWRLWVRSTMAVNGDLAGEVCGLRQGMAACWTVHELRAEGYGVQDAGQGDLVLTWEGKAQHVAWRSRPPVEPVGPQHGIPSYETPQQPAPMAATVKMF